MERNDTVAYVKEQKQIIFEELDAASQLQDESEKRNKIDAMFLRAEEVKKHVHKHLSAMIAYEIRVCNDLIKEIDSRISRERDAVSSKPFKFSFSLKAAAGKAANKAVQVKAPSTTSTSESDQLDSAALLRDNIGLSGLTGEERTLNSDEIEQKEVVLDSLTDCLISIQGAPSALRLINLQQCKIFSGPASGSVFISNCQQCQMQIAGHQLRIHDTVDCDIYQHVRSRSIVENCSKLRFGCYSWSYDQLDADFGKAAMDRTVNNWTQIDDFNCLSNPSPNWSLIE